MTALDGIAGVATAARLLRERGLAVGTSGNVSVRLADGRIALTPATMDPDEMTADHIVLVSVDGQVVGGRRQASSELPLHLAVYAARPDVAAIVHIHSPFATAWSIVRRPIPAVHYILGPLVAPGRDRLGVAEYATFGSDELARNVVEALGSDHAVLLASHGAVAVGPDLVTAFARAERVEELAMLASRATAIGEPALLEADELDRVRDQMARYPRQTGD